MRITECDGPRLVTFKFSELCQIAVLRHITYIKLELLLSRGGKPGPGTVTVTVTVTVRVTVRGTVTSHHAAVTGLGGTCDFTFENMPGEPGSESSLNARLSRRAWQSLEVTVG